MSDQDLKLIIISLEWLAIGIIIGFLIGVAVMKYKKEKK
jgi:hypothetical protein